MAGRGRGIVRWLLVVATAAAMQLWAGGPVWAEQPFRVDDQVTDRVGALADEVARVREALDRLRDANGTQLFVVYVSSFDGMDGQQWSDETARLSQLGDRDVLLAVAVDDRAYGYSVPGDFPLSDSELADLAVQEVEPRLAAGDWAGAAVAMADGLRTGGGAGGDGGGGVPVGALLVGAGIVGGGALLLSRRRRARGAAVPAGSAPAVPGPVAAPPERPAVPTPELMQQANTALIEVDNAVQTSEQELGFAEASFGEEAVTGFRQALDHARGELRQAFAQRQRLDDAEPEDEQTVRAMLTEILELCGSADERLDAQAEAFDRLRDLERTLPEVLAALGPRAQEVQARLPHEEQRLEGMRGRYAAAALAPVTDNVEQARQRLNAAQEELTAARSALDAGRRGEAVVSTRAAEDAVAQASTLLDGIARLESDLREAGARIEAARAETDKDLAEARAMLASGTAPDPAGLRQLIDKAEAALAAAEAASRPAPGTLPDPLAALRQVDEADLALDAALAAARDEQAQRQRSAAILDQALLAARSSVAAASDFIATRRGAVGTGARTRLVEAQRRLEKATALSEQDPTHALREAQQADQLAQEALQVAQSDVDQWSTPHGGDRFLNIASLVLGGILLGGGGSGDSGGRSSGWSPGSFGGSGSGGRRGGGGRF
ncbi:MAG TPA: TPM domain-containing protein [Actinomycetota bacterium]|nr:TPM domain-containing protein [Actinomycetota bacterium]